MVVLVSYGTSDYSQAKAMLARSARKFGIDDIRIYGPDHAVIRKLQADYPAIMSQKRGGGYWLWKAFVIADVLANVPDGTPVLYVDAAVTFVADPAALTGLASEHAVCLFRLVPTHPMSAWTKRDCFIELGSDNAEYWAMPQLSAGYQLYRAGPSSRAFVEELKSAMASEHRLTDLPNIHGLPNLPDFCCHRHDQSVTTIVAHRSNAAVFPDPSQFGCWGTPNALSAPYGQILHIHRRKDAGLLRHLKLRARKAYTGGRYFL